MAKTRKVSLRVRKFTLVISLVLSLPFSAHADDDNLGFEKGTLEGWTVVGEGRIPSFVSTLGVLSGTQLLPALGWPSGVPVVPTEGTHFFVFDMSGPSKARITRALSNVQKLEFDVLYINDDLFTLQENDSDSLDLNLVNQWLRVDLLKPGADLNSLDPDDILQTLWGSNPEVGTQGASSQAWQTLSVSSGSFSQAVLRVITVNTQSFLTVTLDNLRLTYFQNNASEPDLPQTDNWKKVTKDKNSGLITVEGNFEKNVKVISVGRADGSYENLSRDCWVQEASRLSISESRPTNPITSIQIFNGAVPLLEVIKLP